MDANEKTEQRADDDAEDDHPSWVISIIWMASAVQMTNNHAVKHEDDKDCNGSDVKKKTHAFSFTHASISGVTSNLT